jgi:hypothetical protein
MAEWDTILVDDEHVHKPDMRLKLYELRDRLQGNRTYYVRTDGNDANDGETNSTGGAWATLQYAGSFVHRALDLNGFGVTIEVIPGTYNAGVVIDGPFTGGGPVTFNTSSYPSATIVNANIPFEAANGAKFTLTGGFKPQGVSQNLVATQGGKIHFSGINFGAGGAGVVHIYATRHGYIDALGSYLISAGGSNHVQASHHGNFRQSGGTVILNANVTFSHSVYFALTEADITITGDSTVSYGGFTATGLKFYVSAATFQWSAAVADSPLGSLPGQQTAGGRFLGAAEQSDIWTVSFTLDISTTGDQTITVPFFPGEIHWIASKTGATTCYSEGDTVGFANYATANSHVVTAGTKQFVATACIYVYDGSSGNIFEAAVTARTWTSVTITKAKTGSPTGSLNVTIIARRPT